MALIPIKIPPGFFRNGTQYQVKNRWYKGNLIRFAEGRIKPIGGWLRLAPTQILKKGAISSIEITSAGSSYSGAGALTATGGGSPTTAFAGTYTVTSGKIVTVTITNKGAGYSSVPTIILTPSAGSAGTGAVIKPVVMTGVDPVRGLHSWRLSSGARYLAIGSTQSIRIFDSSQSAGTNAPLYEITPSSTPTGNLDFKDQDDFQISGLGYGALEYGGDRTHVYSGFGGNTGTVSGGDLFGTPRYPPADPIVAEQGDLDAFRDNFCPVISFDNFADTLLFCHSGEGSIWTWGNTSVSYNNATQTATSAVLLSSINTSAGVPIDNTSVLVTPERHIMILGAGGNQRKINWASSESYNFTPSNTNTAGGIELQTKGRIVGGFKTRYGVLIFTTSDVWKTNYVGSPFVYSVERLTEGGGPVGMKAIAGSTDFVVWMSRGKFYSFNAGYIEELQCDVGDFVFSDINMDIEGLIAAGHNAEHSEVIFYYPKEGDTVNTRYVVYNYLEKHWTTGELQRTQCESADALGFVVWAGADGFLYRHEMDPDTQSTPLPRDAAITAPEGIDALSTIDKRTVAKGVSKVTFPNIADENHLCFAETGSIEAGDGSLMSVNQIITDTESVGENGLRMKVTIQNTPDGPASVKGPFLLESDGYTDCRFTSRQSQLRIEAPFDQQFRFGEIRFNGSSGGQR